jgi:hypothetical protein
MSTRAAIIRKTEDGIYEGIYCHHDGDIEGVGLMLKGHYTDPNKVAALMALGDISSLGEGLSFMYGTEAYMRDRHETGCESIVDESLEEVIESIVINGFVYLFEDGKWTCNGEDY